MMANCPRSGWQSFAIHKICESRSSASLKVMFLWRQWKMTSLGQVRNFICLTWVFARSRSVNLDSSRIAGFFLAFMVFAVVLAGVVASAHGLNCSARCTVTVDGASWQRLQSQRDAKSITCLVGKFWKMFKSFSWDLSASPSISWYSEWKHWITINP